MRITAFTGWKVHKKQAIFLFLVLTLLLLVDRAVFIHRFFSNYIEGDQAIFWYAADEAMHGRFHEPCFFGQSYNSNLEPYLAVPLILAGMAYRYALPVVTQCLALAPFFIFSILFFRKKNYAGAFALLALPLLFPIEYILISSLPRGFVTGLFFVSLGVALFFRIKKDLRFAFLLFFISCGIILNPNCLLLAIPLLLIFLAGKWREPGAMLFSGTGAFAASILFCFSKLYYLYHPLHDYYRIAIPAFSIKRFFSAFDHLDEFLFGNAVIILGLMILFAVLLYRHHRKMYFIASMATLFLLIISLGFDRINGSFPHNPVFLSKGRMFLAVPLFIGLQFALAVKTCKWFSRKFTAVFVYFIVGVSAFPLMQHILQMKETTARCMKEDCCGWVKPVDELKTEAGKMAQLAEKYRAELFVFDWYNEALLYSGPLLANNKFKTLFTIFDRRTWLFEEEEKRPRNGFFLYDPRKENLERISMIVPGIICVKENYPCIYFVPRNYKVLELLKKAGFPIRPY